MLVIKKLEVQEINENQVEWLQAPDSYRKVHPLDKPISRDIPITAEMISGEICETPDGREICIGMTKEAEKVLGSFIYTIQQLKKQLIMSEERVIGYIGIATKLDMELDEYICKVENMNIWKRIKTLFIGYKDGV